MSKQKSKRTQTNNKRSSNSRADRAPQRQGAASPLPEGAPASAGKACFLSNLPVRKNDEVLAEIVGIGSNGEGVGRYQGFTLFIPGALPGEKVMARVVKLKKQYGYGKLLEIVEASPDRVAPPCSIYSQCGGCQLQHLDYAAQLRMKRQLVINNLERIGKLTVRKEATVPTGHEAQQGLTEHDTSMDAIRAGQHERAVIVHPAIGMQEPWRYRNKAQVPIGEQEGGLVGGFYAQGSHRIIDMTACLIQHERNDQVVSQVKRIAQELGIRAYDEQTGRGLLRHVVAKYGFATGETMIVLVTNGEQLPKRDELIGLLRQEIPGVVSICQNINTSKTNVIFGPETRVLWGRESIRDAIGDVQFLISARSFYQVNPVQTHILYNQALQYAQLTGEETVIDAYCGIGTISLFLAKRAKEVYGVEIVEEAIADARRNAELNDIRNVTFQAGAAEEVMPAWREQGIKPDVIIVDPPRKGCDEALLSTILDMRPSRIVYVSCNPSTLARDLRVLEDGGYRTVEVQPVDMFPHTGHVECCASLVRK